MNWQEERYVRVYTRDTPDWVALDWQSRAVFTEILRKCDRRGIIELGRSGTAGLAQLVRVPLEVVERALAQLLEDGCARRDGTTLVVPNFIAAQEASATDARRAREYRERLRERLDQLPLPLDAGPSGDESAGPLVRRESSRAVDVGDAASRTVTLNCAVPSHAEPGRDALPSPPKEARARATRLPADWEPSPTTLERFRTRERVDARTSVEEFRNYYGSAPDRTGRRLDWDLVFVNWVLRDIRERRARPLDPRDSVPVTTSPEAAPDALSPEQARDHFARLELELRGAGTIPWEGSA